MKKTYVSNASSLRLLVSVNGKYIPVLFGWDIVSDGGSHGCSFTTDDEHLQQGIEAHELYGNMVRRKEIAETEKKETGSVQNNRTKKK